MKIEILGSGCKRCIQLGENAQAALAAAGKSAELLKVTNPAQIALRGVMSTPGLVIDGKLVSTGRVLTPEEIGKLLP
jgi:small redox-active disulfide protein 2